MVSFPTNFYDNENHFAHGLELVNPPTFFRPPSDLGSSQSEEPEYLFGECGVFGSAFSYYVIMLVANFFNGSDLYHVISRLNKRIREKLPGSEHLDQ